MNKDHSQCPALPLAASDLGHITLCPNCHVVTVTVHSIGPPLPVAPRPDVRLHLDGGARRGGRAVDQIVFIPRGGYTLHDVQAVEPDRRPSMVAGAGRQQLTDKRYSSQVTFTEFGFATEDAGRNVRATATLMF